MKEETKHKPKICYWAIIQMPDGHRRKYQLSNDLQYAIEFDTPQKAIPNLVNSLIVIPISDYYTKNNKTTVDVTVGKILFIVRLPRTHNTRWITRGQFVHLDSDTVIYLEFLRIYNYLKHDYDIESQQRIRRAIKKLVHYNEIYYRYGALVINSLVFMIALCIIPLIFNQFHNNQIVSNVYWLVLGIYFVSSIVISVIYRPKF